MCVCVCVCSVMSNSATLWTVAGHTLLSMEFSRQEYWSGLPFPTPTDLPDPGIEHASPSLAGGFFTIVPHEKPIKLVGKLKERTGQVTYVHNK